MKWSAKRKSYIRFEDWKAGGRLEQRALYSKIRFAGRPVGSSYAHFPLFSLPLVQKGNSTRPPADKRNPIPCFICLYRRSYPLDRRIIGKTDNNETRDITVNELQLLIADHFCKLEFTLCAQKRYIYHHEKLKLSLFGFKIFILFRVLKYRQLNFIPINIFSIILRNRG